MTGAFSRVFSREIERVKNRKYIIFITVIFPLILCFIICQTFKSGYPRKLPIAVLNNDGSSISRIYERMLESNATLNIAQRPLSLEEGKRLMREKKVYAFVVIPKNFKENIYKSKRPEIIGYYNNQTMLIGGIISKELLLTTRTLSAGVKVKTKMKKGASTERALSQINPISVSDHVKSNPYLNYIYFLGLIAFIHTYQVIICLISIWAIGIELKEGTAKKWLEEADNSIIIAVLGKLAPYFLTLLISLLLIYAIYFWLYGAPLSGNIPFIIFSTILFILSYQFMGILFIAVTGNTRLALSSGAFYTALGFTFAGATFPIIGMPKFAEIYANLLPISHYLKIMVNQVPRGFPVKYDLPSIYWLIGLCIFGIILMPRLKQLAQNESKWYQT